MNTSMWGEGGSIDNDPPVVIRGFVNTHTCTHTDKESIIIIIMYYGNKQPLEMLYFTAK